MNIETILKAAEYLERKEREAEHGYALTRQLRSDHVPRRRASTSAARYAAVAKTRGGIRSSHNELEKNRRAHLRHCLEQLKSLVPLGRDATRHTTLGLLNDAKVLIKRLEGAEADQRQLMEQLKLEQQYLRSRIDQMTVGQYRVHSLSESSTASSASAVSSSPSEHDEVDVLGSGSASDADDHSSLSSDSGISAATIGRRTSSSTVARFGQLSTLAF